MKEIREINKYSKEEKLKILKEIESGKLSLKEAARRYSMTPSGISYWKIHFGMRRPYGKRERARYADLLPAGSIDSHRIRDLEYQLGELKLKVADLYLENDLLKKLSSFVQTKRKQDSSIVSPENLPQFLNARKS
jgi:transposase-like protein